MAEVVLRPGTVVDGDEAAARFYGSRGFVKAERVPAPPYPDDIWMRREA